jgi:hypothetical protein
MQINKIIQNFNTPTKVFIRDVSYFYTDDFITEDGKYVPPKIGKEIFVPQGEVFVVSWENNDLQHKIGFKASKKSIKWESPQDCRVYLNKLIENFIGNFNFEFQNQQDPQLYLNTILSDLNEQQKLFRKYKIKNKEYFLFKNFIISYIHIEPLTKDEKQVTDKRISFQSITNKRTLKTLENYSLEFNNLLEQLKEIIQSQTKNFPLQNFIPKLGTQLTVSELALLFRLLDEEKIFNNRHKTDIYRFIVDSFESVKQKQISESSIKNKFLTPEISAIEKIKTLLTNLKIQLQRLENDISK